MIFAVKNGMLFAVVGSRDFLDYALFSEVLDEHRPFMTGIVSGGARGADTLAARYAIEQGIPFFVHPADWDNYGKSAGYRRNKLIVQDADYMIAFLAKTSKGTRHSIDLALEKGIEVRIVNV